MCIVHIDCKPLRSKEAVHFNGINDDLFIGVSKQRCLNADTKLVQVRRMWIDNRYERRMRYGIYLFRNGRVLGNKSDVVWCIRDW